MLFVLLSCLKLFLSYLCGFVLLCCWFVLDALVDCVLCVLSCIVAFSVMRLIYVGLFVCVHV